MVYIEMGKQNFDTANFIMQKEKAQSMKNSAFSLGKERSNLVIRKDASRVRFTALSRQLDSFSSIYRLRREGNQVVFDEWTIPL